MAFAQAVGGTRYSFPDLRTLLAQAGKFAFLGIETVTVRVHENRDLCQLGLEAENTIDERQLSKLLLYRRRSLAVLRHTFLLGSIDGGVQRACAYGCR